MLERIKNDIEIIEEKGIKNTFLFVKNLNVNVESYETKILLEENIENIIKFQVVYEGENRALKFDVSNTISLEEFLKINKLKKKDVCDVIDAIDDILTSTENYLLSENSIALDLKLLRVVRFRNNNWKLKFIMLPNYNQDFSYELSKFLIRILRFIDIEDKNALTLAYSLFVKSSKENYTINDLVELVDSVRDKNHELAKGLDILDREALNEYDEKNAEELIVENVETVDQNMIFENISNEESYNAGVVIDKNTDNILNEELFEKFDDNATETDKKEKVINIKTGIFNLKNKKFLSGHISIMNIMICRNIIVPIAIIAIPVIFYLLYGMTKFIQFAPYICVYEMVLIILLVINNILDNAR